MRIGAMGEAFGVSVSPPSVDVDVSVPEVDAEISFMTGDAPPAPDVAPYLATVLQTSGVETLASRYSKYLTPAIAANRYSGASIVGSAEQYKPGSYGPPSRERAVYVGGTEVPTAAVVAGGVVAVGLAAFAAHRFGLFGKRRR